ncbi:MAG: T9SS type A sorting domain-containing protein [Flavobacteriales bacterium]|jgi:hypothetical protein|nr:T9SS type A sorting domain-containing protein [Flavobacteriales bacterium]
MFRLFFFLLFIFPISLIAQNIDFDILNPDFKGDTIRYAVHEDVNSDGEIDLVITGENSIVYYENRGANFFKPHRYYHILNTEIVLKASDFNGDSNLDFISIIDSNLYILFSDNQNNLTKQFLGVYTKKTALEIADFDQDSDQDILVGTSAGLRLLSNDGTGNFTQQVLESQSNKNLALLDMNGDQIQDAVSFAIVSDSIGILQYNAGNSSGFVAQTTAVDTIIGIIYPNPNWPSFTWTYSVNELAVYNPKPNSKDTTKQILINYKNNWNRFAIYALENEWVQKQDTFIYINSQVEYECGFQDLNNDSIMDIYGMASVGATFSGFPIEFHFYKDPQTYATTYFPKETSFFLTRKQYVKLEYSDFDNNGIVDTLRVGYKTVYPSTTPTEYTFSLYLNNQAQILSNPAQPLNYSATNTHDGDFVELMALADGNIIVQENKNEGFKKSVVAQADTANIPFWLAFKQDADKNHTAPYYFNYSGNFFLIDSTTNAYYQPKMNHGQMSQIKATGIGDLNHDGKVDLVSFNTSFDLKIHYNQTGIDSTLSDVMVDPYLNNLRITSIEVLDINNDNLNDIVCFTRIKKQTAPYVYRYYFYTQNSNGSFTKFSKSFTTFYKGLVDVDQDGFDDIVLKYGWHRYDGVDDFDTLQSLPFDTANNMIIENVGMINHDGFIDYLVLQNGKHHLYLSDFDGNYHDSYEINDAILNEGIQNYYFADYNADGFMDMIDKRNFRVYLQKICPEISSISVSPSHYSVGDSVVLISNSEPSDSITWKIDNSTLQEGNEAYFIANGDSNKVVVYMQSGNCLDSLELMLYPDLSIKEYHKNTVFSLVPNPGRDFVQLYSNLPNEEQIHFLRFRNALGFELKFIEGEENIISVDDLPAGVYFVEIKTNKNYYRSKWTKQ